MSEPTTPPTAVTTHPLGYEHYPECTRPGYPDPVEGPCATCNCAWRRTAEKEEARAKEMRPAAEQFEELKAELAEELLRLRRLERRVRDALETWDAEAEHTHRCRAGIGSPTTPCTCWIGPVDASMQALRTALGDDDGT